MGHPLAPDQPPGEQDVVALAAPGRREPPRIDAVRDHVDRQTGLGLPGKRAQVRAERRDVGRVAPDAPHERAEGRIQPPQALVVTGHVRAAQRDDVGQPRAKTPPDHAGRPAGPAMRDVEALPARQGASIGQRPPEPFRDLARPPEPRVRLGNRQAVDAHMRRKIDPLDLRPGATGHQVDLDLVGQGQLGEQVGAGGRDPAAERRILVAQHQHAHRAVVLCCGRVLRQLRQRHERTAPACASWCGARGPWMRSSYRARGASRGEFPPRASARRTRRRHPADR